jgi:hypothetical protein
MSYPDVLTHPGGGTPQNGTTAPLPSRGFELSFRPCCHQLAPGSNAPVVEPSIPWKKACLCLLAFLLVGYDAFCLGLMIQLTPKNDFGRTFLSAVAFVHGEPMYAMNDSIPWKIEEDGTTINLWNLNPPHFHLLLLPLAWLPIRAALMVWLLVNVACGTIALRLVAREAGWNFTSQQRQWVLVGFLGFIGTQTAFVTGHMSFLLFWLVTLSWIAARHDRWTTAGVTLGLGLSLKPFLLFLVPYFLWRRQWRAVCALTATVLVCLAAGFAVFGLENHRAWREVLGVADNWAWLPMNASLMGLLTRTFGEQPIFTPLMVFSPASIHAIWLVVGIPLGLVTYVAGFKDPSQRGVDRAYAVLLTGALLLSPLGWTYYFWLPLGPLAVMAADWWGRRGEGSTFWSRRLVQAAIPGLVFPLLVMSLCQHSRIGTVLFCSVFFWALLLVWLALVLDGFQTYRTRAAGLPPRIVS